MSETRRVRSDGGGFCGQCKKSYRRNYTLTKRSQTKTYERTRSIAQYGITVEEFHGLLAAQKGRCAICRTDNWGKKGPHIDHCHYSSLVRGLLCNHCNVGLGMFKDDPGLLEAAKLYLLDHSIPAA